jgi:SAM-dependent methyltransferase
VLDPDSLERLIPHDASKHDGVTHKATLALHLERYELAARYARPGRVLDLACGVGYGTRLVFDHGTQIREAIGVDLSDEAVRYAREHYAKPGIDYRCSDALVFTDRDGFDTVISLETIEHVRDPRALIERLVSHVRPGGVLIASVPTTPSADVNPHHLHDFTERSFRALVERPGLREVTCLRQVQPYSPWSTITRKETRMQHMRQNLIGYYARHPRAAIDRVVATLRFGFTNRYLTGVWRRD